MTSKNSNSSILSNNYLELEYERIEKYFSKLVPTKRYSMSHCSATAENVAFWKKESLNMISIKNFKLKSKGKRAIQAEKWMLRNTLINIGYIRLYLLYIKQIKRDQQNLIYWLPIAAGSSPLVGHPIKYYFSKYANDNLRPLMTGYFNWPQDKTLKKSIAKYIFKSKPAMKKINQGNLAIYSDMHWQFLMTTHCGVAAVAAANYFEYERLLNENKVLQAFHYKYISDAFFQLKLAQSTDDPVLKRKHTMLGNIGLVEREQRGIIQEILYTGLSVETVSALKWMNFIAFYEMDTLNQSPLLTFEQFCKKYKLQANLTHLETRMRWMLYVVKTQSHYLDKMQLEEKSKYVYFDYLNESYQILKFYKQ